MGRKIWAIELGTSFGPSMTDSVSDICPEEASEEQKKMVMEHVVLPLSMRAWNVCFEDHKEAMEVARPRVRHMADDAGWGWEVRAARPSCWEGRYVIVTQGAQ